MKALSFVKKGVVLNSRLLLSALCVGATLLGSGFAIAQDVSTLAETPAALENFPPSAGPPIVEEQTEEQTISAIAVESRIVLSISDRTVSLFSGDTLLNSYPVAVGAAATPTPTGQFTVSQMVIEPVWQSPWTGKLHAPGPNSALGLRWIGFTATAAGSFGFHGTPTLNSIGKAVSNGCVRMRNEDVVALFERVDVGTPVTVVP